MSRALSTSSIIEKGDYLNPDFDPATLTVPQLLGIFGYHNIEYHTPYTKPKLIQLFNDELRPQIGQFKKDRLSRQNSQASDDGITDGITGRPINEGRRVSRCCAYMSSHPYLHASTEHTDDDQEGFKAARGAVCRARKPLCPECVLNDICPSANLPV